MISAPRPEITAATWTMLALWIPASVSSPGRTPERREVRSRRNASTPGVRITIALASRKAGIGVRSMSVRSFLLGACGVDRRGTAGCHLIGRISAGAGRRPAVPRPWGVGTEWFRGG
ncbi:hypothetical protein GCM10010470_12600 [Saccharopolyspora taberi]|uniref:Secreted protein n=1 Tax=Saccharopolyspora taberi TaxID=60895 RepID=A0ABN3V6C5_9PSEU